MRTFFLVAAAIIFAGYGKANAEQTAQDRTVSAGDSSRYTYSFSINGCATGVHSFTKLEDMCKALQDDRLNNYCAIELRQDYHDENCP